VTDITADAVVHDYLRTGLRLGRHLDGLVDAYYGPESLSIEVDNEPVRDLAALVDDCRRLVVDVEHVEGLEATRRAWLLAQLRGLHVTARKLSGEDIPFVQEVEGSYGVTPRRVTDDELAAAHESLEAVVPGSGLLGERLSDWREAHAVNPDDLQRAIDALSEWLRAETLRFVSLPDEEHIDFELVRNQPWSGFNYYLGNFRSRVAINVDLPVLSLSLGHLVAHEAYPGHHTEHSLKELGLVRKRKHLEETIFLVGTPQCTVAEGLADLALRVIAGDHPQPMVASILQPLGIRYDTEVAVAIADASDVMSLCSQEAAIKLHADGMPVESVIDWLQRWALLPRVRAEKSVQFLTDPTWRAYISCYAEGMPLCRTFVGDDQSRFVRLLTEQLTPASLVAA